MSHSHDTAHHQPHAVPFWILCSVFIALLFLTWITVEAIQIDLGGLNVWIAIFIATLKVSLVLLYFMHLRYDHPINAVFFISSLVFVALFLSLALMDTMKYQPDLIKDYAPAIEEQQQ